MSRLDDAKASINVLSKYIEPITEACLTTGGQVIDNNQNDDLVNALLKANLAIQFDGEQVVQINKKTRELILHVTRSYRQKASSGEIADLEERLRGDIALYKAAKRRSSFSDMEIYQLEIKTGVYELREALVDMVQHFAFIVQNDFSNISDIEIKLSESERCIKKATSLNEVLSTMTIFVFSDLAAGDVFLEDMLIGILIKAVDNCSRDMVDSNHRLRESHSRLQKDIDNLYKSDLIDAFYAHYQANPSFVPVLDMVNDDLRGFSTSAVFNLPGFKVSSTPNINDEAQSEKLSELLVGIYSEPLPEEKEEAVAIEDNMGKMIDCPVDPIELGVQYFFDALSSGQSYSAISALRELDLEERQDIWLTCLMNGYHDLSDDEKIKLKFEYIGERDKRFNGNLNVTDIVFECL